jgi:dienelactone hydrolase
MTAIPDGAVTGTAAGVPFVALPPAGARDRVPIIAAWHLTAAPGSPAAMAAALPLRQMRAWRVFLGLPGTGSRKTERPAITDLLLDWYAPMIEQAAAEFPAALAALREQLTADDGPVAVMGGSAGGHVALLVLTGGQVPVAAAALVNPAVRAESVVAVNEGPDFTYQWSEEARTRAATLDMVAAAAGCQVPLLLVTGEHEYPEFRPDQDALLAAFGGPARHVTIPGMAHGFAEPPGIEPAPQGPHAAAAEHAISDWLSTHFTGG